MVPRRHRHVVECRALRSRPGADLFDDVEVPHLVVVEVSLDELEQYAIGIEEEGDTHVAGGVERFEVEGHAGLVEQLGTFVETGDGEPEVAEPELQVVGDPARRLAVHAMQADDDRTAVEPRLVGVELWGVDDRQLEVSGVEVDGTVEVGDVDVDEADREHWHGRHLRMLAVFVLPNVVGALFDAGSAVQVVGNDGFACLGEPLSFIGRQVQVGSAEGKPRPKVELAEISRAQLPDWLKPRQPRTTTTGQWAWWTHLLLTEPSSRPRKPPSPRLPTTSRLAPLDASISAGAAW